MLLDYREFGEFKHELFFADVVEEDPGLAAFALALDREHLSLAEFGMIDSLTSLYGCNLSRAVAGVGPGVGCTERWAAGF